ncbi:urate oxidase [Aeoliella sp. ICT_H6.2]|uniref:Uricase n=1 Tax=Aeoliella straminimaris TaxID=2954799 RepID=A0A9X2FDS1_9BACT|nr:urate oxidase [Aeoliella straminimaris]MCO6046343.1 urate oxidase [Aeoliella straminimaris]
MAAKLAKHTYGKHRVRVSKVRRPRKAAPKNETHEFVEVSVDVELEGAFDAAYLKGDNRAVVATDTCKNTIYVLAKGDPIDSVESFGVTIAQHFLDEYDHVTACHVTLEERVWKRLLDSPHSFVASGAMTPTAKVTQSRGEAPQVSAGFEHLLIAKTTETGFADFHQSRYRTLSDTDDRILATDVTAAWDYDGSQVDYLAARQAIVEALLGKFIDHYSRSVQETLYLMGGAALEACDAVTNITLTLPNKHHILADLARFGLENENEVFVVTDEPFGYITATVAR